MRADALASIGRAWAARDQAALATAGRAAGLELSLTRLQNLYDGASRRFSLDEILATLCEAREVAHGIAYRESASAPKVICIAVRTPTEIVAATCGVASMRDSPSSLWPALRPWYKQLARNRERLLEWAAIEASDRVRLPIVPEVEPRDTARLEAELVQQIVERPEDPAPRLVLGDLLLERGDVRGELLQLERDGTLAGQQRLQKLARTHASYLAGDIASCVKSFSIAGAFVDQVTMTAAAFRRHGERLFSQHPIRELRIEDVPQETVYLCPALDRVRSLVVYAYHTNRQPLVPPRLARARRMSISGAYLDGPDAERRLATFEAPQLATLIFHRCVLGPHALRGLASNRALCHQLVELELSHATTSHNAEDVALEALAMLELPRLETLRLAGSWFEAAWRSRIPAVAPVLQTLI